MVEPLSYDDILSIMNTFGFTKTWLAGKMKLTRQAVHNAMNMRALSDNADYRFRLLATYILMDSFKQMRLDFNSVFDGLHAEVASEGNASEKATA